MSGRRILLVEDSPADTRLVQEALEDAHITVTLDVRHTGREAMAALDAGREHPAALPDLVLLDLNLPDVPGLDVLAHVKGDAQLAHVPVVVLTTSSAQRDISRAYALHANSYVVKPVGFPAFVDTVNAIHTFWLQTAVGAGR